MSSKIIELLSTIIRKKRPIIFDDHMRTVPISSTFGFERGTPIDRFYIAKFVKKNEKYIEGDVLEIADNLYSKEFMSEKVRKIDVLDTKLHKNVTIIGDLTKIDSLPEAQYDCFICTQTLNFIFQIDLAIKGIYHLLKPGGTFIGTVAGICQISRYDMDRWGDYWRFTSVSISKLFENVFATKPYIETFGNVATACAFLQGVAIEELPSPEILEKTDQNYQIVIGVLITRALK
ncbi:MAG: methyltransferase domain-containing protein [Melioribacteraceae bacterium]